jgi:hypothetical protein
MFKDKKYGYVLMLMLRFNYMVMANFNRENLTSTF